MRYREILLRLTDLEVMPKPENVIAGGWLMEMLKLQRLQPQRIEIIYCIHELF